MEKGERSFKSAMRRVPLNISAGMFGAILGVNVFDQKDNYPLVSSASYLLNDQVCPDDTGHNDLHVRESVSLEFSCCFLRRERFFLFI